MARKVSTTKMSLLKLLVAFPLLLLLSHKCSCKGVLYYQEPEGNTDGTCSGHPNTIKPWIGEPKLKAQIANGSLYTAGEGDDQIYGNLNCVLDQLYDDLAINNQNH